MPNRVKITYNFPAGESVRILKKGLRLETSSPLDSREEPEELLIRTLAVY